eukprot:scaffold3287_cov181-Amphora_coffeaeformis.AAC.5
MLIESWILVRWPTHVISIDRSRHAELLAEEKGHRVLFQPPHHSDFQPIELLWAKLKGNIGRKYDSNRTMAVLKERLDEEFGASYGWNESIEGMIQKSTKICKTFYN